MKLKNIFWIGVAGGKNKNLLQDGAWSDYENGYWQLD